MAPPKNRRPGFSKRAQYSIFISYLLAVFGLAVGLLLLVISKADPAAFAVIRAAGTEATAPLSRAMAGTGSFIGNLGEEISAYFHAGSKNARLQRHLDRAQVEIAESKALKLENARLRKLLQLREENPDAIVMARMISTSASSTRRLGIIDAGSMHGVERGQPVRAAEGLVGRILEVGPSTSRALLVTDGDSVIPVKNAIDGVPAIATGLGDGTVKISAVNLGVNPFKVGDLIVTSGSGGLFTPNIPVAVVIRMSGGNGIGKVLASPATSDYVIVQPVFKEQLVDELERVVVPKADGDGE